MTFYDFSKAAVGAALRMVWRLHVVGAERVPLDGPLIVACNHVSYFDPPALGVAAPRPLSYMAKVELFRIPILGPTIAHLNAYPVDRTRGDVAAIRRSVEVLRAGKAIGIFPEGTRNRSGEVRPQTGVALLASLSGAPVLPACVVGTSGVHRFERIQVIFGDPIHFGRKASREDLAKWTGEIMTRIAELGEQLRGH